MNEKLIPHGYAPGKYWCRCKTCGERFDGEKRSWRCMSCATKRLEIHEQVENFVIEKDFDVVDFMIDYDSEHARDVILHLMKELSQERKKRESFNRAIYDLWESAR